MATVVSFPDKLFLIGGQNADTVFRSVHILRRKGKGFDLTQAAALPEPLTNLAAARIRNRIYAFGGQTAAQVTTADNSLWSRLWSLDANSPKRWTELLRLPGEGRILPAATACGDTLYILGGAVPTPARRYLSEAWSFHPTKAGHVSLISPIPSRPHPPSAARTRSRSCSAAGRSRHPSDRPRHHRSCPVE